MTDNSVDVVFITALSKEREAMISQIGSSSPVRVKGHTYDRGFIQLNDGGQYSFVIVTLSQMGNVHASAATTRAISVWNPAYIVLIGITAGMKKAPLSLGDVLIAEQLVYYEYGKQEPGKISRRYQVYRPARVLLEEAKRVQAAEWALKIPIPRPDGTSNRVIPMAHFGVVASGEKVVKDPALGRELQQDWIELVGVEMEGVGTAIAAYEDGTTPGILFVKGVCDWGDTEKNDAWQAYAAHAAAAFAVVLLRRKPFASRERAQPIPRPQYQYSGIVKINICRRLDKDWQDLADYFEIPLHHRARFDKGREPQEIWEWLEVRRKLLGLRGALEYIGREDLAKELS